MDVPSQNSVVDNQGGRRSKRQRTISSKLDAQFQFDKKTKLLVGHPSPVASEVIDFEERFNRSLKKLKAIRYLYVLRLRCCLTLLLPLNNVYRSNKPSSGLRFQYGIVILCSSIALVGDVTMNSKDIQEFIDRKNHCLTRLSLALYFVYHVNFLINTNFVGLNSCYCR